jgi:hypothetical protein
MPMHRRAFLERLGLTAGGVATATVLPDPEPSRSYFFGPWKPAAYRETVAALPERKRIYSIYWDDAPGGRSLWPVEQFARGDHSHVTVAGNVVELHCYEVGVDWGSSIRDVTQETIGQARRAIRRLPPGDSTTFVWIDGSWHVV